MSPPLPHFPEGLSWEVLETVFSIAGSPLTGRHPVEDDLFLSRGTDQKPDETLAEVAWTRK